MLTIARLTLLRCQTLERWDSKNPDGFAFLSNLRRKFVRSPDVLTRIGGQGKVSTVCETRDPSRAMPVTMAQPQARVYMRTREAHRKEGMDADRKGRVYARPPHPMPNGTLLRPHKSGKSFSKVIPRRLSFGATPAKHTTFS